MTSALFRPRSTLAAALLALAVVSAPNAYAVGTRTFQLDTLEKFQGGEVKGAAIGSDGVVRAGLSLGNTNLTDASAVFSALAIDGGVLVGTSPNGKIMKVSGDQETLFAETGALAVTSIIKGPGGAIYAATMPDGKIFKVSQGKADLYATLKDAGQIWALASTKAGLFAATGPDGKVFKVEPGAGSSEYFKSEEANVVSLAVGPQDELLAGTATRGIVYRITGPGKATVLADFAGDEVKALVVHKDIVFAIVNEYSEPPEPPRRTPMSGSRPPGAGAASARPRPGKGALYRIDGRGRSEKLMSHSEFHYMSLAVNESGEPFIGTGAEGRVYTVDDAHAVTLVADTDERQVGALVIQKDAGFIASSDPAVFHRVLGRGGQDALWTSKVLDCGLPARFGALGFRAQGSVEFSTRTGNTQVPDKTWSAWSNASAGQKLPSPGARYVQVRARMRSANATLSEVTVPFVTENMRAIVTDVSAQPKTPGLVKEPVSSIPSTGNEAPKKDATVRLTWKVDNPDNDSLRFRLSFQRDGQSLWRDVLKADELLSKTDYDWDTSSLPEGKYRLRVEASDEFANPPGDVQKHALVSDPFLIDNTPPVITSFDIRGRRLTAQVRDGLGPIVRAELTVNGQKEFRPVGARDGIFDSAEEALDADISSIVPAGPHIVTLRVYDGAGNSATAEREVN